MTAQIDISPAAKTHELRHLLVAFISKRVAPQDVEDVVQTVFLRIQRGLSELREGDKLLAWAYQIARNTIVDYARHASLRRHESMDRARAVGSLVDDAENVGVAELAKIVGDFIAMLPAPYGEALQMTELEGLTQAEAARRSGISLPGMKSRVQRGRARLRELLEECCDIAQDTRGAIIDVEPRNAPASIPNCCSALHPSSETSVSRDMTNQQQMNEQADNSETKSEPSSCGGPAPADTNACCMKDAAAKAAGDEGCGCAPKAATAKSRCC